MTNSLGLTVGVIVTLNATMFFLVDKYCDLFYKYGVAFGVPKELCNFPWFRRLARIAHVIFCILAVSMLFLVSDEKA